MAGYRFTKDSFFRSTLWLARAESSTTASRRADLLSTTLLAHGAGNPG